MLSKFTVFGWLRSVNNVYIWQWLYINMYLSHALFHCKKTSIYSLGTEMTQLESYPPKWVPMPKGATMLGLSTIVNYIQQIITNIWHHIVGFTEKKATIIIFFWILKTDWPIYLFTRSTKCFKARTYFGWRLEVQFGITYSLPDWYTPDKVQREQWQKCYDSNKD